MRRHTVALPAVRRGAVAGAVAALLGSALVGVAAPAGAAPAAPPSHCSDTTGVPYATGLPPLPCTPFVAGGRTRWTDNGQLLLPQGPANLFVGERRLARAFTLLCTNAPSSASCPAPVTGPQPPASTPAITVVQQLFVQSQAGAALQYGELARVPVSQETSAGRVTGTLVLSQTATDGVVAPVLARVTSGTLTYNPGTTVPGFEQYGPNPGPSPAQVLGALRGVGPATAALTGVAVDGAPVDLGSCRVDGALSVAARGGWAVGSATLGGPAEYRPFDPPSYLHATFGRTAVVGCAGVDPAVVAVLNANAGFLTQSTIDFTAASPVTAYGCLTGYVDGCFSRHPAVVDPRKVPAVL